MHPVSLAEVPLGTRRFGTAWRRPGPLPPRRAGESCSSSVHGPNSRANANGGYHAFRIKPHPPLITPGGRVRGHCTVGGPSSSMPNAQCSQCSMLNGALVRAETMCDQTIHWALGIVHWGIVTQALRVVCENVRRPLGRTAAPQRICLECVQKPPERRTHSSRGQGGAALGGSATKEARPHEGASQTATTLERP